MDKKQNQGMEQMLNYILKNGRKENKQFFESEQEKIALKGQQELKKLATGHEERLSKIKQSAAQELEQELQRVTLSFKRKLTLEKQYYLELVVGELQTTIQTWSEEEFLAMIQPVLVENKLQGRVEVTVAEASKPFLTQKHLAELATVHSEDITYQLTEEVIPNDGGFVLSQSGIEYNYLFSSMLGQVSEEMEFKVAQLLFEDEVS